MDHWKFFDITHRNHTFMNPSSNEKLEEMIGLLQLAPGARVLDIACGKAEPLARIANSYDINGMGVDLSPFCIAAARKRAAGCSNPASKLEFLQLDGREFRSAEPFDLAICLGATWVYDGFAGTLKHLATVVKPQGLVLVGEPYWRREPASEYLSEAGFERSEFSTHPENVHLGVDAGLNPLYAIVSSEDDWDRYEWLQTNAAERYALEHPEDPDLPAILSRVRLSRDLYLRWGRETLGWCIYLFMKP